MKIYIECLDCAFHSFINHVVNFDAPDEMKERITREFLKYLSVIDYNKTPPHIARFMQQKIREFIRSYNQKYRATIILTSHYMDDVKELCSRVIVIDKGRVFFDGQLAEIIKKFADRKILEVVFDRHMVKKDFASIRAAKIKTFSPLKTTFTVKRTKANEIAAALLTRFPVVDLNITESSIEDIIREVFTGRDLS